MKQTTFTTIILEAAEGMYLTQAAEVAAGERVVGRTVALGANDAPGNWREITAEEAAEIERQREAARAAVEAAAAE